jgi:hypothetical protein
MGAARAIGMGSRAMLRIHQRDARFEEGCD